ncbi:hypothetical protein [Candidatus Palauibacter sp.]|uniref:hypothetical protein n=1 Tax=Candidatus Palauibacter sp. TaxID=3101350 RepID=UPI003B5B9A3E
MSRRTARAVGLVVLVLAGWPSSSAAQRPAAAAQAALAADMASEDGATAVVALRAALRISRQERGAELRSALVEALAAHGRRPDEGAQPAPGYEALADHVNVLLEEVRAMEDPAAIPALLWSPDFGSLEAVAVAEIGCGGQVAALEAALEMATWGGDRTPNGLFALRIMVELWGGAAALPPEVYALLVDAATLYLDGPGERYPRVTSSATWRNGMVVRRALGLAAVLDDPGLRARMEQIASDVVAARQLGVTEDLPEGSSGNLQTLATDLLGGKPPDPRPYAPALRSAAYTEQLPSAGRDDPILQVSEALPSVVDVAEELESGECLAHFARAWSDDYTPVPLRVEFPSGPTPPAEPPEVFEHERKRGDEVAIRVVCLHPPTAWHREYLRGVLLQRLLQPPGVRDAGGWLRLRPGWNVIRSPEATPGNVCAVGGRPPRGSR